MEPFYFTSYGRIVGKASDIQSLRAEMERLAKDDPGCLSWHLAEGHISQWLNYIGERGLAEMLKGVSDPGEAIARIRDFSLMRSQMTPKRRGRKR